MGGVRLLSLARSRSCTYSLAWIHRTRASGPSERRVHTSFPASRPRQHGLAAWQSHRLASSPCTHLTCGYGHNHKRCASRCFAHPRSSKACTEELDSRQLDWRSCARRCRGWREDGDANLESLRIGGRIRAHLHLHHELGDGLRIWGGARCRLGSIRSSR